MIKTTKQITFKLLLVGIALFFLGAGASVLWATTLKIPDFDSFFQERSLVQSTKIYDKTGEILLYDVFGNARRTVIPLEEMGDHIKNATIAIEDSDFYNHGGIKISSIIRAFIVNLSAGEVKQGGSTLTQQVIKNTILTTERKLSRKIKEVILSIKLEQSMSKDDILALYLNETPYGGNIYGIQEASRSFFGKDPKDLTIAESAYLASLPQAPTFLSPYGKNKDRLEERKNTTLRRMSSLGFIGKEEYENALNEEVVFQAPSDSGIKAPHFVFHVIDELTKEYDDEDLKTSGLKVITTLDWEIQKKAEETVVKYGDINERDFNAGNAGMVIIDPKTGGILAMVGSRDYFNVEREGNFNVTTAKRQPGSTFKPFVYATAFMKGYTTETILFDLLTEFNTNCDPEGRPVTPGANCYMPHNYDETTAGPITMRKALAESRNIPAVKTLYLAGINNSIKTAKSMGINSLTDPDRYGLSLVLGGGEVTLLEITSAYSTFANEGLYNKPTSILEVSNSKGDKIKETEINQKQVIPTDIARMISSILDDDLARVPTYSPTSLLNVPGRNVAVKTGTTNDYRDAWIIGYTPSITIGVWAGNNDNSPMEHKISGLIVAPMWSEMIRWYLSDKPNEPFNPPPSISNEMKPTLRGIWEGGQVRLIDTRTNRPANERTLEEYTKEEVIPNIHSILYWVDKNNPLGEYPRRPENDPQFILWEAPVIKWANSRGLTYSNKIEITNQNTNQQNNELSFFEIQINSIKSSPYKNDELVKIEIDSNSKINRADFYINNIYLGSSNNQPFNYSFIPKEIGVTNNTNEIKVVAYTKEDSRAESKAVLLIN